MAKTSACAEKLLGVGKRAFCAPVPSIRASSLILARRLESGSARLKRPPGPQTGPWQRRGGSRPGPPPGEDGSRKGPGGAGRSPPFSPPRPSRSLRRHWRQPRQRRGPEPRRGRPGKDRLRGQHHAGKFAARGDPAERKGGLSRHSAKKEIHRCSRRRAGSGSQSLKQILKSAFLKPRSAIAFAAIFESSLAAFSRTMRRAEAA